MRRVLAILLLFAFASPLIVPLAAATADPQSSLPACCRHHGKHHCAMAMLQSANSGPAFQAPPCPLYPAATVPLRIAAACLTISSQPSIALLRTNARTPPATHAIRAFILTANLKRGPPIASA
jgi:hypothetical protein